MNCTSHPTITATMSVYTAAKLGGKCDFSLKIHAFLRTPLDDSLISSQENEIFKNELFTFMILIKMKRYPWVC